MRTFTLGLLLTMLTVTALAQNGDEKKSTFRVLDIPAREHGYANFQTQVIATQKQYDDFIKASAGQFGWNKREVFLAGLKKGKIDFSKEVLVLLRNTEGSGSNKVTFQAPEVKGNTLICKVKREVAQIGTADIADYCFAVAVDRSKIREVRYAVDGKKEVTLTIGK